MSEQMAVIPLSGAEIVESVVAAVREKLVKDCFLSGTSAYEAFSGQVTIHLVLRDIGRLPKVDVQVSASSGDSAGGTAVEASLSMEEKGPNAVRVESGQRVPVVVETGDGRRETKHLAYKRP